MNFTGAQGLREGEGAIGQRGSYDMGTSPGGTGRRRIFVNSNAGAEREGASTSHCLRSLLALPTPLLTCSHLL